jgi:hypothetical protein
MSAKSQYNILLKSGLLLELYDNLSGVWSEDKHEFERIYEAEEFYSNNIEIEEDGYEEF